VMDKGRVRQIGTPHQIYLEPADTFVATFVGTPPMNLVDMERATLGFRPENFLHRGFFGNESHVLDVPFRLQRVEYLGNERLLYGVTANPLPEAKVVARIPSTLPVDLEVGAVANFGVRRTDLHWFDRSSGRAIAAPEGALHA